jgi:HK97 family phage prohead protease
MPLNLQREYRTLTTPLTASDGGNSEYLFEGYATTFDAPYLIYEDRDGDKYYEVISREALAGADMSDVIMQYNHEGRVFARTSNGTLTLAPDSHGLRTSGDLSRSAAAKELHAEIKAGLITRMSWCFTVAEDKYDRETHTRTITKIKKVYDVSAVSIPANDDTIITARGYVDGVTDMLRRESAERIKRILQIKLKIGGIYQ